MGLDTLEFRTPIVDFPTRDGRVLGLFVNETWQRRLSSLWAFIKGTRLQATLDFPNTLAGQSSPLTVSVPGVALGDFVSIGPAAAGLIIASTFYAGFVSAAGIVTVLFVNVSAAPINPPSGLFQIRVIPQ